MTTVIHVRAKVDENGMIHVQLPADLSVAEVDVQVTCEQALSAEAAERRLDALNRGRGSLAGAHAEAREVRLAAAEPGALKDIEFTVAEFLSERREDDARREKALGG